MLQQKRVVQQSSSSEKKKKKKKKKMRDFASCFSEHAVKVSNSACSGSGGGGKISAVAALDSPTAITSLYRTKLPNNKDLLVKLTWSKTHLGTLLSLGVSVDPCGHNWNPDAIRSHLLRQKKGKLSCVSGPYALGFHWDYSAAKFNLGPEPVSNYFVVIVIGTDCALLLGDLSRDYVRRFEEHTKIQHLPELSLVGRKEQVVGLVVYSTKARFGAQGRDHDLAISCKWDRTTPTHREGELVVVFDRKKVVEVKNLGWKFRGNATIYVDGWPVDVMWDLKEFGSPQGYATFMFRRRSATENSLWCEEEMVHRERGLCGFSLWIQAFKTPQQQQQQQQQQQRS